MLFVDDENEYLITELKKSQDILEFIESEIAKIMGLKVSIQVKACLLYTSPSPRDLSTSRMPSSA